MRPGYKKGVEWIALNDEPMILDVEEVENQISVLLLADLFGKEPRKVAEDVVKKRRKEFE